ncbi:hypothetical protein VRK_09370 [Vibrio sp. MEBiC08052]|nr:hypothetical protein VRK_09370 [Vibrio sp. MEBiC08052]
MIRVSKQKFMMFTDSCDLRTGYFTSSMVCHYGVIVWNYLCSID